MDLYQTALRQCLLQGCDCQEKSLENDFFFESVKFAKSAESQGKSGNFKFFSVTAQLISAFVFIRRIVHFL